MEQTDNAPEAGGPRDTSVNNDTRQQAVLVAVMQPPSSASSPPATTTPNFGNSVLTKRKAAELLPSLHDCNMDTFNTSQQASLEPVDMHDLSTPSGNTKRHKVKVELFDTGSPNFPHSDLFVEQDDASTVAPAATASPPSEGVTAFLDASIATLFEGLRKIESEQTDLPTAPPQPKGGRVSHKVAPYDTAAEKKASRLSIDRPSFGAARRIEEAIVDFVLATVQWLDDAYDELHDDEILVFSKKLKAVVAPQKYMQHTRSAGLISGPGTGKSLLISNLLNLPGAAISMDSDSSITNVRHEYTHAGSQLRAPVVAVVHPFAESTISSKIRNRVSKVLECRNHEQQAIGDADKSEHDVLKQEKAAALDYLSSLVVGPHAGSSFLQVSSLENFITKNPDVTEQQIVQHIFDCVQAYQRSRAGTTGPKTFEANNISTLQSKDDIRRFAGYLEDSSDPRTMWRLIEKISMHIPALVLENGTCLNDVPGIGSDTDQSRIESGEEAYKDCGTIILLKRYSRSSSSQTLMNDFRRCIRDGKNVVLAITHLDSVNSSSELENGEERDEEFKRLAELRKAAEQEAEDDEDFDMRKLSEIANLQYQRRIDIRKQSTTTKMEDAYRKLQLEWNGCEGEKLRVFPVLNRDHSFYVKGFYANRLPEDRPRIPIEETGVIALRTFLRGIPAEVMLRTLMLSKTDLERFLVAIELYCTSSKLERKREIEHHVIEPKEDCALEIEKVIKGLKTETEVILEKVISDHELSWMRQGERLSEEWGTKQHNNYLAFCKRKGNHQTGGEKENWNDAIQKIMLADLVNGFKLMYDEVKRKEAELLDKITDLMKKIVTSLKDSPLTLSQEDLQSFYEYVNGCRIKLEARIVRLFKDLEVNLREITSKALAPEESYLTESMQIAYDLCKAESGKGSHGERKAIMKAQIESLGKGVFRDVIDSSIKCLHEKIDDWKLQVAGRVYKSFGEVERQFHSRYLYEDKEESQAKRDAKYHLRKAIRAAKEALPTLAREIEKCEE